MRLRTRYGVICKVTGKWLTSSDDFNKIPESKKNVARYEIVEAKFLTNNQPIRSSDHRIRLESSRAYSQYLKNNDIRFIKWQPDFMAKLKDNVRVSAPSPKRPSIFSVFDKESLKVPHRPFLRQYNCRCYVEPKEFDIKNHVADSIGYHINIDLNDTLRPLVDPTLSKEEAQEIVSKMFKKKHEDKLMFCGQMVSAKDFQSLIDKHGPPQFRSKKLMFTLGQQVFSPNYGYGKVVEVDENNYYVTSQFDYYVHTHDQEGKPKGERYKTIFTSKRAAKEHLESWTYPDLTIEQIRKVAVHNQTIFVDSNDIEREFIGIDKNNRVITQISDKHTPQTWGQGEIQSNRWYIK